MNRKQFVTLGGGLVLSALVWMLWPWRQAAPAAVNLALLGLALGAHTLLFLYQDRRKAVRTTAAQPPTGTARSGGGGGTPLSRIALQTVQAVIALLCVLVAVALMADLFGPLMATSLYLLALLMILFIGFILIELIFSWR